MNAYCRVVCATHFSGLSKKLVERAALVVGELDGDGSANVGRTWFVTSMGCSEEGFASGDVVFAASETGNCVGSFNEVGDCEGAKVTGTALVGDAVGFTCLYNLLI